MSARSPPYRPIVAKPRMNALDSVSHTGTAAVLRHIPDEEVIDVLQPCCLCDPVLAFNEGWCEGIVWVEHGE
jgi:hypothetical protein